MKILIAIMTTILLSAHFAAAQQINNLKDLKRPRFEVTFPAKTTETEKKQSNMTQEVKAEENSRFAGTYKGKVTVHYKKKLVTAEATLHIVTENQERKNHYDSYIIPETGDYLESTWKLEGEDVRRSVTISGDTVYVTDIIEYSRGGNSQIRTLVFSPDYSALTFLKTEFDDSQSSPATGQIIGRFIRVK